MQLLAGVKQIVNGIYFNDILMASSILMLINWG